jgi:hypothetical protein
MASWRLTRVFRFHSAGLCDQGEQTWLQMGPSGIIKVRENIYLSNISQKSDIDEFISLQGELHDSFVNRD